MSKMYSILGDKYCAICTTKYGVRQMNEGEYGALCRECIQEIEMGWERDAIDIDQRNARRAKNMLLACEDETGQSMPWLNGVWLPPQAMFELVWLLERIEADLIKGAAAQRLEKAQLQSGFDNLGMILSTVLEAEEGEDSKDIALKIATNMATNDIKNNKKAFEEGERIRELPMPMGRRGMQ